MNNINITKNFNKSKNKNEFDGKITKYMKQRFRNCIKKNSKDKINNLCLNLSNNNNSIFEKNSKSSNKAPNSILSKNKNDTCSNKKYFDNKILNNKDIINIKFKNSNNSSKNNSVNKNKKINNKNNTTNIKNKKNKNFLYAVDFSNVIKKSISKNKNVKNKIPINFNDLLSNLKNNVNNSYIAREKSYKEHKTNYHVKNRAKYGLELMKYSPINRNQNNLLNKKVKSNSKEKNISTSINMIFIKYNNSKEKSYTTINSNNKYNFISDKMQ